MATEIQQAILNGETVLIPRVETADTPASRTKGLLGRESLDPAEALWIVPCPSIHMFFMKFAIDAVFLDREGRVTRVFRELPPWDVAFGGKRAHSVLECAAGALPAEAPEPGDLVTFIPASAGGSDHCEESSPP